MTTGQATTREVEKRFIWIPLIGLFFVIGTWFALLVPFFQGPDEQVHYATLQRWAEPDKKTWPITEDSGLNQGNDIRTYHFSEEVRETAHRLQFDELKWQPTNTQSFSVSPEGQREAEVIGNNWKRYVDVYPANTSGTWSLYYWLGSDIERFLAGQSILDRIFFARLFSLCIGALTVLVAFMTARRLGWSPVLATLFSSLIAFQTMFLATSAVINIDILLVFAFSIFFYGAVLWITDGLTVKPVSITLAAALIGIFTKGPGIVLLGLLAVILLFSGYRRYRARCQDLLPYCLLAGSAIVSLFFLLTPAHILANFLHLGSASVFSGPIESIGAYLEKTFTSGAFIWTAMTYWGSFGWLDTNLPESIVSFILATEVVGIFGLIWLLFDKNPPRFLPNKQILLFALISLIFLQLAIRFFDWRIFDTTGKILIGTPGRYFLPNIIPHLLLIVSGLGYFTRTRESFQKLLLTLSISLFALTSYALWFIILPRYYL
ncbi:MAG: DUF2142 domain-containing protein [Undibacterium sp.]